jgi:glycosyltransferase involved in cell wall biosynthesis
MRIAIFTDNDFAKVNGVTTTLNAVLRWRPADLSIRIYTAADVEADTTDYLALASPGIGIPFYSEMKMYVPRFFEFLARARRDGVDLIHFTTPGPVGLAAMFTRWRMNLPMVGSFHTQLSEYTELLSGSKWLGDVMREYQRWPYGKCERILVPSDATRALLVSAKINPEKIRIWTRGVDAEMFSPERRSDALRREWGVHDQRPALIYVGRLSREKGVQLLPSVSRSLRDARLPHRLIFVGDGPMRAELQHTCPDALFTGAQPHERVAEMMAASDLFLFPSRTDTLGNVVLEAQAAGLPVLVSDAGGPRENIKPGETGFICEDEGPLNMTMLAARLLSDRPRRLQMARAARQYALGRRWDVALAPLYQTYRDAILARAAIRASSAMPAAQPQRG